MLLYADDITFWREIMGNVDGYALQEDLDVLIIWFNK